MKKDIHTKIWEVVVIGGGPAGMMAAGRAAENGRSVLLLEKNTTLGNKLMLTGGGRCNLTNYQLDNRMLLTNYHEAEQFLYSAFAQFDVEDTINFFRKIGVETKVEDLGRVFPISNKAKTVLEALKEYMKTGGVEIRTEAEVIELKNISKKDLLEVSLQDGQKILAKKCVLATGGMTYPETGSTGQGLKWLKKMGHNIIENQPSLVPIILEDKWVADISGVTLEDVKLIVKLGGKKMFNSRGSLLFTHFGISGPMVLNMSKRVGELLKKGEVIIELDLKPDSNQELVKEKLYDVLQSFNNKKIKNILGEMVVSSMVWPILEMAEIDGETPNHSLIKEDRLKIVNLIKALPLKVKKLKEMEKAIYAVGGVDLTEINFKTMQSKIDPKIYIVGDLLNIDRPSGGYSLQLCWTTGYVAGDARSKK